MFSTFFFTTGSAYAEVEEHIQVFGTLEASNTTIISDIGKEQELVEKKTIISGSTMLPKTNDSRSPSMFFIGIIILFMSLFISMNRLSRITGSKRI